MGREKRLSDVEKAKIKAHAQHEMGHDQIADILARSRSTVTKYLVNLIKPRQPKKLGRPTVVTDRQRRSIVSHDVILKQSSRTIQNNSD